MSINVRMYDIEIYIIIINKKNIFYRYCLSWLRYNQCLGEKWNSLETNDIHSAYTFDGPWQIAKTRWIDEPKLWRFRSFILRHFQFSTCLFLYLITRTKSCFSFNHKKVKSDCFLLLQYGTIVYNKVYYRNSSKSILIKDNYNWKNSSL